MKNIVSDAFNLGGFFTSGVDVRTRTFNLSVTIGQLHCAGLGNRDIKIGYDMLSQENEGFGKGWLTNTSRYNKSTKRLRLSDGRSFVVYVWSNNVEIQYYKQLDFKAEYVNSALKLTYLDGTVENFYKNGLLKERVAPSGHRLTFVYRGSRLQSIVDEAGKSLKFKHNLSGVSVVHSDGSAAVQIRVSSSGLLSHVFLPESATLSLKYRNYNGFNVIEYVNHPTGKQEQLIYDPVGIKLPDGGPVKAIPCIRKHRVTGSGEPLDNSYSREGECNFLGYGLSRFVEYKDRLIETDQSYTYICTHSNGKQETVYTYNKYHQNVEVLVKDLTEGILIEKVVNEFYSNDSLPFSEQLPQYKLLKSSTKMYFGDEIGMRESTIHFEYDPHGNILSSTDEYGRTTKYSYYCAEGENGAPSSKSGFPYLLKEEQYLPSDKYSTGREVGIKLVRSYEMLRSIGLDDSYPVLRNEEKRTINGDFISSVSLVYEDNIGEPELHGLVSQEDIQDGGYSKIVDYTYYINDSTLETIIKVTPEDITDFSTKTVIDLHTSKILEKVDEFGNITSMNYDRLGRNILTVSGDNSCYAKEIKYIYNQSESTNYLDIEVSDGTKQRVIYDRYDREVEKLSTDSSGNLKRMYKKKYDSWSRLISFTEYDDFGQGEVSRQISYSYDIWGEVCAETDSSGLQIITVYNKAENMNTTYQLSKDGQRGASTSSYFNELNKPIRNDYHTHQTLQSYDGFGQLSSESDPNGNVSTYQRDSFQRIETEIFSASNRNELRVTRKYNPRSVREELVEVRQNDLVQGSREYDSLGRVICETKGEHVYRFEYTDLGNIPTKVVQPDGSTITNVIEPFLREVISQSTSDGEITTHSYEIGTGRLCKSSNSNFSLDKVYYPNGELKAESQSERQINYTYSRQGRLLNITDYFGGKEAREYDEHFRLKSVETESTLVELEYNAFSLLESETITSRHNRTVKHIYSYDDHHRLIEKVTTKEHTFFIKQSYVYNAYGQLITKLLGEANGRTSAETYNYDSQGRLSRVMYSGFISPSFEKLGPIYVQEFKYDSYGNTTEVLTQCRSGEVDRAEYNYDINMRLLAIKHSHPCIIDTELEYDRNGNLKRDEKGHYYQYNAMGQLKCILDNTGNIVSSYSYGPDDKLMSQSIPEQGDIEFYYAIGELLHEAQESSYSRLIRVGGSILSRRLHQDNEIIETALVSDFKGSVISEVSREHESINVFSVYGRESNT